MNKVKHMLAITMWDFSWIERNWSGAGFEDWDKALDELVERGYNAVRIDAFPHLLAEDMKKEWTLLPVWYSNDWGSPYINKICLYPAILLFIEKCRNRNIKVALSSWYREDINNIRMKIESPRKMAENWLYVLDLIKEAGLLNSIIYLDLCNEWPGDLWAPYFLNEPRECTWGYWHTDVSMQYMKEAITIIRSKYSELPLCFSFDGLDYKLYSTQDLSYFDLIEHHLWMAKLNENEFYRKVGQAKDGRYTEEAYHLLTKNALNVYYERPEYWKSLLVEKINELAQCCNISGLPLVTTECWGIVDYKDFPLLPWEWIKELCELGVKTAVNSGQWAIVATSNFAAPQFKGMWQDIEWHKKLTDYIKDMEVSSDMKSKRIYNAL